MYFLKRSILFLFISSTCGQTAVVPIERLSPLNVNREWITLSGFSSGGSFAQQLYISYSSLFSGIAVFSHTYYRCGPITGVQDDYDQVCTKLGNRTEDQLYNPINAILDIQDYFSRGLIENPSNLVNKPLYVYAGTRNVFFTLDMSLRILEIFEPFIQNPHAIRTRVQNADLVLPTDNFGDTCPSPQPQPLPNFFLANCGFSGAFEALEFLLGSPTIQKAQAPLQLQPLRTFDQTEFIFGFEGIRHDMDTVGFMYIPTNCQSPGSKCLLHLYFHGCMVGREFVGSNHIVNSGYLQVAEYNNIIMIFPQVISSPANDIGCWDTYGFTGPLYATQRGAQVTVVRNILQRILGTENALLLPSPPQPQQTTPIIPQVQIIPVVPQQQTIPGIPQQQANPVIPQQQTTPVIPQFQTTPSISKQQPYRLPDLRHGKITIQPAELKYTFSTVDDHRVSKNINFYESNSDTDKNFVYYN